MSQSFHLILDLSILPGEFENFRAVAKDLIASAQTEPGTLSYEWNLSPDKNSCHVYERYRDSASFLTHAEAFGPFAERFLKTCRPMHVDVYGSPNEEAQAALADFKPTYHTFLDGFSR
ncbi:MAG TPA: antibiotic biosynthesis monooxygenase [Candidatus Methylacidiphilales bacterium]